MFSSYLVRFVCTVMQTPHQKFHAPLSQHFYPVFDSFTSSKCVRILTAAKRQRSFGQIEFETKKQTNKHYD